ncbi:uncharacterized protein LOC108095348 [Drosophila ficusphila]|uniref:uncharacterized protein LOC108095348 n=1 Tax=Drosophila ficusphila TaxID=30025 RepID=UPI0007E74EFF|nr:uncharacterized protein LOC108095348 [Drosophila ficusphila]
MSYQIKSTPFFRRMFNNSKKNGQLQKLRDEYERIQEFNDRTLEMKMRDLRLKRLFREIEEMKEGAGGADADPGTKAAPGAGGTSSPSSRARRSHGGDGRTLNRRHYSMGNSLREQRIHDLRVETLTRARELGKEISRRNALMAEAGTGRFLRSEIRLTAKMQAAEDARRDADDRRERAAKRISYGNDMSRQNIQRLLLSRQRRLLGGSRSPAGFNEVPHHLDMRPIFPNFPLNFNQLRDEQEEADALEAQPSCSTIEEEPPMTSEEERDSEERRIRELRNRNPELAAELERRRRRRQEDDEAEEEEQLQRRRRQLRHEDTSPLRLTRISLSSIGKENGIMNASSAAATAGTSPMDLRCSYREQDDASADSDQEMHTAPLANEDRLEESRCALISFRQPPRGVPKVRDAENENESLDALNNWHKISLMLPWFKAFPDLKSSPTLRMGTDDATNCERVAPATGADPMYSNQFGDADAHDEQEMEEQSSPFPPPDREFVLSTFEFVGIRER